VTEILEKALRPVEEQWQGGKVTVERAYDKNLPPVPLDATLCEQVFVNLVQNAFDAMGEQGGILRLEVAERRNETAEESKCGFRIAVLALLRNFVSRYSILLLRLRARALGWGCPSFANYG